MRNGLLFIAWRFLKARPLRTALSTLSVALGAGLLAALLTLNATMDRALEEQLARQFGRYELMAGYRQANTRLSADDVAAMGRLPGVAEVAGVLIPYMGEFHEELTLRITYYGAPDTELGRELLRVETGTFPGPGEMAVMPAWAKERGLQVGDTVTVPFAGRPAQTVRISGLLPSSGKLQVGMALFDAAWLGEAAGRPGATFVMIDTRPGTQKGLLAREIQKKFPELDVDQRKMLDEMKENLNALRPVALGMGLACLLAAAFLLTGAFRMSLSERTRELAMLRAVAATPAQVRRLLLAEGLLVGLAGSGAGVLLGAGSASGAAGVTASLLQVEPTPAVLPWGALAVTGLAGVLLAVLSALQVARAAGNTEPLRAMRPDLPTQEAGSRRGGRFGLVLAAVGAIALAAIPLIPQSPTSSRGDALSALAGGAGGLFVALGLTLGAQRILPLLLPLLAAPFRHTVEGPVAVRSLLRHRRRSGLTMAAMSLGLVLIIAISTIATSLIGRWYEDVRVQHPADVQVEVPGLVDRGVSSSLIDDVKAIEGVTRTGAVRDHGFALLMDWDWSRADQTWLAAMIATNRKSPALGGWQAQFNLYPADLPALVEMGAYRLTAGSVAEFRENAIALNASTARERGIQVGDTLKLNVNQDYRTVLQSPAVREYRVVALVESNVWRMPSVLIPAPVPGAPDRVRLLYVDAAPGQEAAVRDAVRDLGRTMAYSMADVTDADSALAALRAEVTQRFVLLVAVGVVLAAVAVMSLTGAMAGSVAERRREFAMLRSVGATPAQVRNMVLLEGGLLGLAGALVGLTGGAALGAGALFGLEPELWTVIRLPWPVMGAGLAVSLLLALAAAAGPARRVMQTPPAEAVRVE